MIFLSNIVEKKKKKKKKRTTGETNNTLNVLKRQMGKWKYRKGNLL